jgi:hypothetical protein
MGKLSQRTDDKVKLLENKIIALNRALEFVEDQYRKAIEKIK